jgi:hypothetical protein
LLQLSRWREIGTLSDAMTTTAGVDLRAIALDKLCALQDAAAALGVRVEGEAGRLPPSCLALVYSAAEGCCRLPEACRAALPAEGEQEAVGGEADAT